MEENSLDLMWLLAVAWGGTAKNRKYTFHSIPISYFLEFCLPVTPVSVLPLRNFSDD